MISILKTGINQWIPHFKGLKMTNIIQQPKKSAKKYLKVLVACEYSGRVREAFAKLGHYAMSCDFLPSEAPGNHYQGDVRDVLYENWDMMIAHPSCTYLTNAGVKHLHTDPSRWIKLFDAAAFFKELLNCKTYSKARNRKSNHAQVRQNTYWRC